MSSDLNSINTNATPILTSTSSSSFVNDQPVPANEIVKLSADEFYLPCELNLSILGYLGHREKSAIVTALAAKERIGNAQDNQKMTSSDYSWNNALILDVRDHIRIMNSAPFPIYYPNLVATRTFYGGHPSDVFTGDVSTLEEEDKERYTLSNQDLESRTAFMQKEIDQGFTNQTSEKVGVLFLLAAKNNHASLLPSLIKKLALTEPSCVMQLTAALVVGSCHGSQDVVQLVLTRLFIAESTLNNPNATEEINAAIYRAIKISSIKDREKIFTMSCQAGLGTPHRAQELLTCAINEDQWDMTRFLLRTDLYAQLPNISGDCFVKALVWAAKNNHIDIVEKLVSSPFTLQDDLKSAYLLISEEKDGKYGDPLRIIQQQIVALDSGASDDENEFNDSGFAHGDNPVQVEE